MAVVIETNLGDFTVDLYTKERPQTCRNFLKLCKIKYYNFSLFLNVQSNFIAQTGDPTATGKGGQSVYGIILGEKARFYEAEKMPKIKHEKSGLLSMVNCGNNMLGSQFLITLAPELQSLDGQHCVFGEITEGLEIILKLNETICDADHRPYQDIRISHTVILEDPYEDPEGLIVPDRSPEPTKELLMTDRIGADEEIDDTEGLTAEQIAEMHKEKEAKARATILEIVGDIPDAEIAPPENVLFVCKLNPVTNDDDLEIIFSRFGKIVGCEVIRDRQSGDSLQYAFIEFADKKSCEEAYFKMDNVLIDDRRIHVDFSQSVSKMRWRGKGRGIQYFDENSKNDKEREGKNQKRSSNNNTKKRRSRSPSPRNRPNEHNPKTVERLKQLKDINGESKKHDERDKERSQRKHDRFRSRSRSKDRTKDRRKRSRSRSRERPKDRRHRSRETSTERSSKRKEKMSHDGDDKKSRSRDERKKSDHRADERNDKYSSSQRRRKSRERSEERYERRSHKYKHKTKDR